MSSIMAVCNKLGRKRGRGTAMISWDMRLLVSNRLTTLLATRDSRLTLLSMGSKSAGTRTLYPWSLRIKKLLKHKIKVQLVRVTIRFLIHTETLVNLGTIYTLTHVENMMVGTSILWQLSLVVVVGAVPDQVYQVTPMKTA